jgi:hypothetical protein
VKTKQKIKLIVQENLVNRAVGGLEFRFSNCASVAEGAFEDIPVFVRPRTRAMHDTIDESSFINISRGQSQDSYTMRRAICKGVALIPAGKSFQSKRHALGSDTCLPAV